MMLGHRQPHGLLIERDGAKAVHALQLGEHQTIQLPLLQPLEQHLGLLLVEVELQLGEVLPQILNDMGQQIGAHGGNETDVDLAGHGLGEVLAYALELAHLFEHLAGLPGHGIAGRGKQHLAGGALDQDHPQLIFQLAQLAAQGRLADEAALRRLAKMFLLFQRYQVLEIAKVHRYCILPIKEAVSMPKNGAGDKGSPKGGIISPAPLVRSASPQWPWRPPRAWPRSGRHQGGEMAREGLRLPQE